MTLSKAIFLINFGNNIIFHIFVNDFNYSYSQIIDIVSTTMEKLGDFELESGDLSKSIENSGDRET